MKFVYLDKKERVRAWLASRHGLLLCATAALLLFLPLWHETILGRFLLEPSQRAVIRPLVPGAVTHIYAQEGSSVSQGAPLFRLRNLPLQSRLARSQSDYTLASIHATSALLHYSDVGTALEERNRLDAQSRDLASQAASLDLTSPISGVVLTARPGDLLGSFVPVGTELAEIADLREMRARIYVSEYDLYKVKMGAPARLVVDGSLNKRSTRVAAISPQSSLIDPALAEVNKFKGLSPPNFYVVDMLLDNPEGTLKPGMVGLARIYGQRRSLAWLLWSEAKKFVVRKVW